jgi:hypothetical protein
MKTILIGTYNLDKYRIITALFNEVLSNKYFFNSIYDVGINIKIVEKGSILNRAEQKAINIWNHIIICKQREYFASIGIDDGFSLEKDDEGDPNSKLVTEKILKGTFIKKNQTIWLKRGIALYNQQGLRSVLTTIPFKFLGNPNNIKRQEGAYSLMEVLKPINGNIALNEIKLDDAIHYYLSYCYNDLKRLFKEEIVFDKRNI